MHPNQVARETVKILFEYGPRIHNSACKVMDIYTPVPEFKLKSDRKLDFFIDADNSIVINSNTISEILGELQEKYSRYDPTLKELVVYSLEEEIPHYNHFVTNPEIRSYGDMLFKRMIMNYRRGSIKRGYEYFRYFVLEKCYMEGVGKKARILVENEIGYPGKHFDIIFSSLNLKNTRKWWDFLRENIDKTHVSYMNRAFNNVHYSFSEIIGRHLALKWSLEDMRTFARQWKYEFTDEDFEMLNRTTHALFPHFDEVFPWLIKGFLVSVIKP